MSNWALQQAVYTRLDTASAIKAIVTGIYDHVPQAVDSGDDGAFPYLTIGADTVNEFDTDDVLGFAARVEVHVWSRQRGRKQVKQLQDLIYTRLHRQALTITGYHFVSCDFDFADSFVDADGLTRHGVQQFRVLFEAS